MTSLGTLEELPLDYRKTIEAERLAPLWPMLRDVLPHDAPKPITKPCLWAYQRGARNLSLLRTRHMLERTKKRFT